MNVLLDLLGALIVGTTLLLMMMTFQFQLSDTANRAIFASQMIDHEMEVCSKINSVFAMAGVGMKPDSTVVANDLNRITFRTYWNYNSNSIAATPSSFEMKLATTATGVGKTLIMKQNGETITDAANIFYLEDLAFVYYDKYDVVTADKKLVRSVDVKITLRRDPPRMGGIILRTRVQLRCYFMNCYMRGA